MLILTDSSLRGEHSTSDVIKTLLMPSIFLGQQNLPLKVHRELMVDDSVNLIINFMHRFPLQQHLEKTVGLIHVT